MLKKKNAILKIGILCTIFLFALSIVVFGDKLNLSTVKIQFANGSQINIFTTKTKVSDILADANIKLSENESVLPDLEETLNSDKIIIYNSNDNVTLSEEVSLDISTDTLKSDYNTITEKIVTVQEEIPFETIEKNVSSSVNGVKTTNKILQQGVNGLKEVTYKFKYRNSEEISKEEISSKIIKEPINKIVQIVVETVTSRSDYNIRTNVDNSLAKKVSNMSPTKKTMNVSAYTASTCGKSPSSPGYGITASGAKASSWYTIAAGSGYKIGTIIYIPYFENAPNKGWFVVQDRGGAISNTKIDIYMNTYNECIQFGRKNLTCYIYEF